MGSIRLRALQVFTTAVLSLALAPMARADAPAPAPELLREVAETSAKDYPSANSVLLVDDQSVVYQADGSFSNTTHEIRLALTEAGREQASHVSIDYAKGAESVDEVTARIVRADGSVESIPTDAIQDTPQSGGENIYDANGRSVKVTFAHLGVGDPADLSYRLTRHTPTRPGFFNDIFEFQATVPILHAAYRVDAPAALPLVSKLYHPERGPKVSHTEVLAGARIYYAWTAVAAPQLIPEPRMDPSIELPTLVVTTDPSWQDFSRWWWSVSEPRMKATDVIQRQVAALTKNARTDEQKIRALYDFVASDVRYRGLGLGPRSGYTPRSATETLQSRWGVCRDVAILLATMLRAAGLEAYPVLTNFGDPVLPDVAYDGFNHAIVAMPAAGGGWRYLDPTAKNSTDLLPLMESDQSALVCTPGGEPLGRTPPAQPAASMGHATARSVLGEDGTFMSDVTLTASGVFDLALRSMAALAPAIARRQAAESVLHAYLPEAELVSFEMSDPLALSEPLSIQAKVRIPHPITEAGSYRLLRTMLTSGALGLVDSFAPSLFGALPTRKYGLDVQVPFAYLEEETVTLPEGAMIAATPNPIDEANAVSELASRCETSAPGRLLCRREFQVKQRRIDADQYQELRSMLSDLSSAARQPIILTSRGASASR